MCPFSLLTVFQSKFSQDHGDTNVVLRPLDASGWLQTSSSNNLIKRMAD